MLHFSKQKGCKVKKELLMSVLTVGVLTMTGCGSSDDSSSDGDSVDLGSPSQITTKVEAKKAIAASSQANLGSNNNKSAQRVAAFIQKSSARKASTSTTCDGGGTLVSTYTDDTYQNGTFKYDNCVFGDLTLNGTITLTDGAQTGTYSYTNKNGNKLTGVMSVANGMQYFSVNGTYSFDEKITFSYNTFKFGETLKYESGYNTQDCTTDINGQQTCGQEYYVAGKDPHEESIGGGVKINTTLPEYSCFNGTYIYTTEKNMHFLPGKDTPDSGKLDINGVKFEFNGDNTATVTYTDGSTDIVDLDAEVTCN